MEQRMQDREIKGPICLLNHEKETKSNNHQDLPKTTSNKSENIMTSQTNIMEAIHFESNSRNTFLETLEKDKEGL